MGRGAPWAAPLSWLIPPRIALQILLTGDPLTARRAYEIGLVNEVVPLAGLRARTQQVAEQIAANAPLSVLAAKRTAYLSRPDLFEEAERIGRRCTSVLTRRKARPRSATSGRRCGPAAEPGRSPPDRRVSPRASPRRVLPRRVEQRGAPAAGRPRSRATGRMACCHSHDTCSAMWPSCSSARRISAAVFGRSAW